MPWRLFPQTFAARHVQFATRARWVLWVVQDDVQQNGEAVPGDLHTDAHEDEGHDAQNAVDGGGCDGGTNARRVSVTEKHDAAEDNDGDEQPKMAKDVGREAAAGEAGAEGEHHDEGARTGGDGKGEGVKGLLLQRAQGLFRV